ncbi:MAG: ROK family protein [Actinobacteria bacterium]|nr:ROK family protein [Actinomycetota bacterium]
MSGAVAIGVDVGGTKLVAATVAEDGTILERRRQSTPAGDGEQVLRTVLEIVEALDDAGELPVGVGIAAIVDPAGVVRYGPNIGVRDLPLAARLTAATGRRAVVKNDATAAAYGEARVGAGQGADHVVMLTLGTGVGGGVIVDGTVVEGREGFAGELGHVIVSDGGRLCPCGNRGCVEAYASGTAIGLLARERLVDREVESSLREDVQLDGKAVTSAAMAGDEFARSVLEEAGRWLGVAMASLANVLDPELIVVGGGAAIQAGAFMLPAARASMAERLIGRKHREAPRVVPATLSDDAGMIGAGLLAADS